MKKDKCKHISPRQWAFHCFEYLKCFRSALVFPDLPCLWHHLDSLTLIISFSFFLGGGGRWVRDKGIFFFYLLHSCLLPLWPVFIINNCNRQKCLLYSVKPSIYFLPFGTFLVDMCIVITLWELYHPLPYINVCMFKKKENLIGFHISLPQIPSSSIFNFRYHHYVIQKKQILSMLDVSNF